MLTINQMTPKINLKSFYILLQESELDAKGNILNRAKKQNSTSTFASVL